MCSRRPLAARAHDAAPALELPLSLSPWRPSSLLLGHVPAFAVSLPHLAREGPSRVCGAGGCPAAVVLLHLGARSQDWRGGAASPPSPCKGTARSHVNC